MRKSVKSVVCLGDYEFPRNVRRTVWSLRVEENDYPALYVSADLVVLTYEGRQEVFVDGKNSSKVMADIVRIQGWPKLITVSKVFDDDYYKRCKNITIKEEAFFASDQYKDRDDRIQRIIQTELDCKVTYHEDSHLTIEFDENDPKLHNHFWGLRDDP